MKVVKEFLQSSTVHGLAYIATTDKLTRIFWMFVVLSGFTGAAMLIRMSYAGWSANPISTTVDYRPITDLAFPLVTVCPPRNTFTSLNLALRTVENRTLDSEAKEELTASLPQILFDSDFEFNFRTFRLATNLSRGWYSGDTRITFLLPSSDESEEANELTVMFSTSALAGSVSSPFFKQPFDDETFARMIRFRIRFDKPKNATATTNIELKLEFDTDKERYWEEVIIGSGHYDINGWFEDENKEEILERIQDPTNTTHQFPLGATKGLLNRDPYVFFEFRRRMTADDVRRWKTKRNTGMRLSWSYDDPKLELNYKYLEENRGFIKLANILHNSQNRKQLRGDIKLQRNKYLQRIEEEESCLGDNLLDDELKQDLLSGLFSSVSPPGGVPDTPDYEANITVETLEEAQEMYYYLTRCPNFYQTTLGLRNLFSTLLNFPLKTVLVTLTRMMATALEKGKEYELIVTYKGALNKERKRSFTP